MGFTCRYQPRTHQDGQMSRVDLPNATVGEQQLIVKGLKLVIWRFLEMVDPLVTTGFNTKFGWFGGTPILGNLHMNLKHWSSSTDSIEGAHVTLSWSIYWKSIINNDTYMLVPSIWINYRFWSILIHFGRWRRWLWLPNTESHEFLLIFGGLLCAHHPMAARRKRASLWDAWFSNEAGRARQTVRAPHPSLVGISWYFMV